MKILGKKDKNLSLVIHLSLVISNSDISKYQISQTYFFKLVGFSLYVY